MLSLLGLVGYTQAQFVGNICIDNTLRQNQLPGIQEVTLPVLELTEEQDITVTLIDESEETLSQQFCGEYHLIGGLYPYGQSIIEAELFDEDMSFREATQFASCSISGYLNLDTLNQRRDVISMTGYIGSISSQLEEGSVTEIADLFGENNQDALPQWFIINREGDLVSEVGVLEVGEENSLPEEFPQYCQELNCNGRPEIELDVDGDGMENDDEEELDIDNDGKSDLDHVEETDTDGDGIINALDVDIDCDGMYNREDDDMDGDGLDNLEDEDMDGDGIENEEDGDCNCNGQPDNEEEDADGDGIPDDVDPDDDNDGIPDDEDNEDNNGDTGGNATGGNATGCTTSSCGGAQNTGGSDVGGGVTAGTATRTVVTAGSATAGSATSIGVPSGGSSSGNAIGTDSGSTSTTAAEPRSTSGDTTSGSTDAGLTSDDTRQELPSGGDFGGSSGGLFAGPNTVAGNAGAGGGETSNGELYCIVEYGECSLSCEGSISTEVCKDKCKDKLNKCDKCKSIDGVSETDCACKNFDHIFLNTKIPFVGQCILKDARPGVSGSTADTIPDLNTAFPRVVSGLTRLVLTLIVVGAFLAIVVAGFMMTAAGANPGRYDKGKKIIMGVAAILFLIGISGIILNLINPAFFRTDVESVGGLSTSQAPEVDE